MDTLLCESLHRSQPPHITNEDSGNDTVKCPAEGHTGDLTMSRIRSHMNPILAPWEATVEMPIAGFIVTAL